MHLAKNKTATGPMLVSQRVTPEEPSSLGEGAANERRLGDKDKASSKESILHKAFPAHFLRARRGARTSSP